MRGPSDIWEPDAVTRHVRICEGPRVNAARLKYCDTTTGNQWQTVNTKRNLNQRDPGLLSRSKVLFATVVLPSAFYTTPATITLPGYRWC